jgi:catechol 2,3-dioxygenase-like lactoylglutathione lyase family enzyme
MTTADTPVPPHANHPVNHIGLTVPDIFAAIDWYRDVLGFEHIMGPRVLEAASAATAETSSILGPRFRRAYQAHLLADNGIGLELFQFVDPPVLDAEDETVYWRRGYWHLCLTVADLPRTLQAVLDHGGQQVSAVADFVPGKPYQLVYCRDPFGLTLELLSHPYAEVFHDWPQDGMSAEPTWLLRDGGTRTGGRHPG